MSRQAAPRAAAARSSPSAAAASRPVAPPQHEELFPSEESYEAEHEEERAEEEDELHAAPGGEGQQSRDELEDEAEHVHHYQLAPIQPQAQAQSQSQPQRSPPHRVPKPSSLQVQSESQWHATPSNARRLPSSTLASPDADLLSGVRTVPSTPPLGAASSAGAVASVGAGGVLVRPPKRLLDAGLAAVKTNLKPGLALQCVALLIIIVYFGSDSARAGFDRLAEFKSRAGYAFSAVSTSIFGGLLPWLIIQAKKEGELAAARGGGGGGCTGQTNWRGFGELCSTDRGALRLLCFGLV